MKAGRSSTFPKCDLAFRTTRTTSLKGRNHRLKVFPKSGKTTTLIHLKAFLLLAKRGLVEEP